MVIRKIFHFIRVLFVCILIEVVAFNLTEWGDIFANYSQGLQKEMLTLKDAMMINWQQEETTFVSMEDPVIVFSGIDKMVNMLELKIIGQNEVNEPITIFVTFQAGQEPQILFTDLPAQNKLRCFIGAYIQDLRIDIGECAGIQIEDCEVTLNQHRVNFSISRVVAMMLIYYITQLLFLFHRGPDYISIMNKNK